MKKNISIVSILAIVLAFALSSFSSKRFETAQWYKFTGNDRTMASSYTLANGTGDDPQCEALPETVCAIKANDDGGHPVQSELDAIISQSSDFTEQVEGLLEYQEE